MVKHVRVTAVEHPDALPGITRDTLLTLSGADARMVTLAELHDADEIFACGTAAEVAPIAAIDRRILDDHPVSDELAAMYARAVRGEEAASRRSEERRVGKECVSPCRSRWSPYH